jgi:hypothetical protein
MLTYVTRRLALIFLVIGISGMDISATRWFHPGVIIESPQMTNEGVRIGSAFLFLSAAVFAVVGLVSLIRILRSKM